MIVRFRRTGERRYAVVVEVEGRPVQAMDPAPGYDDLIPHDLVHYVVEAELGLDSAVYGRAAKGGGTFIARDEGSARDRARARRKQRKKDQSLGGAGGDAQIIMSERLAGLCDLAFRRRSGQRPDPGRAPSQSVATPEDGPRITQVVDVLERLAPRWRALPPGGELVFVWPTIEPTSA